MAPIQVITGTLEQNQPHQEWDGKLGAQLLGIQLTPTEITPGTDHLEAIQKPPHHPLSTKFSYSWTCVTCFSLTSKTMSKLCQTSTLCQEGEPLKVFHKLWSYLCSAPVLDYPMKNSPFNLITDASLGDDKCTEDWGPYSPRLTGRENTPSSPTSAGRSWAGEKFHTVPAWDAGHHKGYVTFCYPPLGMPSYPLHWPLTLGKAQASANQNSQLTTRSHAMLQF